MEDNLVIKEITVENLIEPIGIDSYKPRFAWKLESFESNVFQKAYQIQIFDENEKMACIFSIADYFLSEIECETSNGYFTVSFINLE